MGKLGKRDVRLCELRSSGGGVGVRGAGAGAPMIVRVLRPGFAIYLMRDDIMFICIICLVWKASIVVDKSLSPIKIIYLCSKLVFLFVFVSKQN